MLASRTQVDGLTTAGPRILVGQSLKRVGLIFFAPFQGSYSVSNEPGAAFGAGVVLTQGNQNVKLWLDVDGDCIQREWYITYTGAFAAAVWIDVLATCEEDQLKYLGKAVDRRTALYPGEQDRSGYGTRSYGPHRTGT